MEVDTEALYRCHGPAVLRRCRRLLRNEEEAVEVMQDTFVQVLRREDVLQMDKPGAFLNRVTTNLCLNVLRTRSRRPETPDDELVHRIATAPIAEDRAWASVILDRLFSREQPSTRVIAVMYLLDGMTHEEVAEEMGMSVSGVRKRLRVLRRHLHELQSEGL